MSATLSTTSEARQSLLHGTHLSSAIQQLDLPPTTETCEASGGLDAETPTESAGLRPQTQHLFGNGPSSAQGEAKDSEFDLAMGIVTAPKSELSASSPGRITLSADAFTPALSCMTPTQSFRPKGPELQRSFKRNLSGLAEAPSFKRNLSGLAEAPGRLLDVVRAAFSKHVAETHQERHGVEQAERIRNEFWLNGKLIVKAVSDRDGADSWQATFVSTLQSQHVQIGLIGLLLVDVIFIFGELFIEAEYPSCRTMSQRAVSCCAAPEARRLGVHMAGEMDDHAMLLGHQLGYLAECPSPLMAAPAANGLQCLESQYAHDMHDMLTVGSLVIVSLFEIELLLLWSALGKLFWRSWAYVLDLGIISSSLSIMLYVYLARAHARDHGDVVALESMQGLIMLGRCWRFVRVGHGIALSMHDLLHASHVQVQHKIEELRQALHVLEAKDHMESALNMKQKEAQGMEKIHDLLRDISRHYGGH